MNFREHKNVFVKNDTKVYQKDLFKFRVNALEYSGLLAEDLQSIRHLLGEFTVVRVKQLWPSLRGMKLWVEKK